VINSAVILLHSTFYKVDNAFLIKGTFQPRAGLVHATIYHMVFLYNTIMIELNIPGFGSLQIEHLVCDVNGTIAIDGKLLDGVARLLTNLHDRLELHLLTADTFGQQAMIDRQLNLKAVRIKPGDEATQKAEYVRKLGSNKVVAIGQGANDAEMLNAAALGICVLSIEGTAVETLLAADLVATDIFRAFELLEKPLRIVASLRK
jgi:soluble P-type ATPase